MSNTPNTTITFHSTKLVYLYQPWMLAVVPMADGRWHCAVCGVVGWTRYLLHRKVCPSRMP